MPSRCGDEACRGLRHVPILLAAAAVPHVLRPAACELMLGTASLPPPFAPPAEYDAATGRWRSGGCTMETYLQDGGAAGRRRLAACLHGRRIHFCGDSRARQLYWTLAEALDPTFRHNSSSKPHQDLSRTAAGVQLYFSWAPELQDPLPAAAGPNDPIYVSRGLWPLKRGESEAALVAGLRALRAAFEAQRTGGRAAPLLFLAVGDTEEELLHPARRNMTRSAIARFNALAFETLSRETVMVAAGRAYAEAAAAAGGASVDGVHFREPVQRALLEMMANQLCGTPVAGGCCHPHQSMCRWMPAVLLLAAAGLMLALGRHGVAGPVAALAYVSACGGTELFLRAPLPPPLTGVALAAAVGIMAAATSVTPVPLGVLEASPWPRPPRQQTDEWKGWMQLVLLLGRCTGGPLPPAAGMAAKTLEGAFATVTGLGCGLRALGAQASLGRDVRGTAVRLCALAAVLSAMLGTLQPLCGLVPVVAAWTVALRLVIFVGQSYGLGLGVPLAVACTALLAGCRTLWPAEPTLTDGTVDLWGGLARNPLGWWAGLAAAAAAPAADPAGAQWAQWGLVALAGTAAAYGIGGGEGLAHACLAPAVAMAYLVARNRAAERHAVFSARMAEVGAVSLELYLLLPYLLLADGGSAVLVLVPGFPLCNAALCTAGFAWAAWELRGGTLALMAVLAS